MATRFSSTLLCDNSTDANFQAWAQFIEDTLVTTGGWVVTSDTGQTAPGSLVHPTAINTKKGYRIYRMADTLQATAPVFIKLEFGSGTNANTPGVWMTLGTGSDGAGNITGIRFNGGSVSTCTFVGCGAGGAAVGNSYGSADTNRFVVAMFCNSSTTMGLLFGIERSKDSTGADTSDGILVVGTSLNSSTLDSTRYIILAGGAQPTAEIGLNYVLSTQNPTQAWGAGDLNVGIVQHFRGPAQSPGKNVVIVNSSDVSVEGQFTTTLYGATRTYQQVNSKIVVRKALVGSGIADNNARACIRYD